MMIQKAGMAKREVAALKGITPETLSRQIHGKIQMTLADAERYAKILDCSPQDVLFVSPAIPVIGTCHISHCESNENGHTTHDVHVERRVDTRQHNCRVYLHTYNSEKHGAIMWSADRGYSGLWEHWKQAVEFVELDPIKNKYVSENAVQHECYAMLEEPYDEFGGGKTYFGCGILYPEPGDLYTLHNNDTGVSLRHQKLIWASASLGVVFRPELRGVEIIKDK